MILSLFSQLSAWSCKYFHKAFVQHVIEVFPLFVSEYMHYICTKLDIEPLGPKVFNKTIQNKIGNIRHERKGKDGLKVSLFPK